MKKMKMKKRRKKARGDAVLALPGKAGTRPWWWIPLDGWSGVRRVYRAPAAFLASACQIGFAAHHASGGEVHVT